MRSIASPITWLFDIRYIRKTPCIILILILILSAPLIYLPSHSSAQGSEEDIVINELMLFPLEGGPWIEIHNSGNGSVSVDDWLISDEDGLTYQFGDLPDMPPGSFIVVHFDHGESDTEFGQTRPNTLHIYTGWKDVRFTRHNVDSDEQAARVAVGYDIVTGGKPEVLVNKFKRGKFFYESKVDMSDEWIRSDITPAGGQSDVHRMKPIDIDADGVADIVSIYCFIPPSNRLCWIKSPPNPKNVWGGPYGIDDMDGLVGLDAGNINGDALMDVVVSRSEEPNHNIYWYACPANPTVQPWNKYTIDNTLNQPGGLMLVDLDNDTDLDIVAVGSWGEEVVWYEHPPDPVNDPWSKYTISSPIGPPGPGPNPQFDGIGELIVRDMDDDLKLDIIVSESKQNRVVWYKYTTTPKDTWTQYIIDDDIFGPSGLDLGDFNGDGDLDVMVAATSDGVVWYPKPPLGELYNPNWPRYFVNEPSDEPLHLVFYANASDLDNDGDLDITTADQSDGKVLWYENEFLNFTATDQCALYKAPLRTIENIIDFVAWGASSLTEDDIAVGAGIWQDETFVDMTNASINRTIARDRYSIDNDVPEDWDVISGKDSDIPTPGMVNYPYPTNIHLNVEYNSVVFIGATPDGNPPASLPAGLCLANYSSYTFSIEVSNPFGWFDLDWVELIFDPNGAGIKTLWTQADNNFTLYDTSNYITMLPEACDAYTDGIYTWHLNFTVIFNWWYPSEGLQNARVTSHNNHSYEDIDTYNSYYRVVKSLNFTGEMLIRNEETGEVLTTDEWVIPGTELEITGPIVIYDILGNQYFPGEGQFNVQLQDNLGNYWVDYTSACYPVNLTVFVPDDALTGPYNLTLTIIDLHSGAINRGDLSQRLQIDADPIEFTQPSPESTVWHTNSTIRCGIRITDEMSGVAGDSIEYRVANGSIDRFGEWQPAPLSGIDNVMEPEIIYNFPDGPNNWVQWRAKDAAGNGPTSSSPYQVPVDTNGISFHDFYPSPLHIQNHTNVSISITLADFGGSGVNLSTLQVAIKPAGDGSYSDWFDLGFIVESQTAPISDDVPCGPESVHLSALITGLQNGTDNCIKFRVLDMAGNKFSESEEFSIQVNIPPVIPENIPDDTVSDEDFYDYWPWILLLLIILVVLVILTIWHYLHRLRDSDKREGPKLSS